MKNQSAPTPPASAPLPRKASRKVPPPGQLSLNQSVIVPETPGQRKRRMIPVDQIELLEEFAFREKVDEETVERYAELWAEYKKELDQFWKKKTGDEPKCPVPRCPFPNISVLKTGEEKYAVISGVHRLKSAQKAGLTGIYCDVLTDREEAIKQGLQDNREHGLQLSRGDLRKCILVAQKEFGGCLSKREIARLVGCSHAYLNSVFEENQLEGTFQLNAKVKGRDGKLYQATKPKGEKRSSDKTTSGQTKKQSLDTDYGEVCLGIEDTGERNSVPSPVVPSELEGNDIQADPKPCATGNVEGSQRTAPLCELPDSLDDWEDSVFVEKFGEWIEHLPIDDERRLTLFPELIRKLLDGFKKQKSRIQLRQWFAEYLAPCSD